MSHVSFKVKTFSWDKNRIALLSYTLNFNLGHRTRTCYCPKTFSWDKNVYKYTFVNVPGV